MTAGVGFDKEMRGSLEQLLSIAAGDRMIGELND
jgi:hypothetical protein